MQFQSLEQVFTLAVWEQHAGYITTVENDVPAIQKPLPSNFRSSSTQTCLHFSERLSLVLPLCSTPSISSSLDCMTPQGWWMRLVSHLDLSTVTSQTLCRYCSLFPCTILCMAVYENTLSIPSCTPCLMLSLWTRGLASMGNISWDHIWCIR